MEHGTEEMQRDLLQIKLRDNLVRQRVDIISSVRFTLKSLGVKLRLAQHHLFRQPLPARPWQRSTRPARACTNRRCGVLDAMTEQIRELEKAIEELACAKPIPRPSISRQIAGVGTLTSLTFVLTIGDPARFDCARDVAAYLGLVPKRDQSGDTDKQLRISKAGDAYLRRLLVGAAHYILGPFGPDCELKRKGLETRRDAAAARAKKKAVVAIARKLSVLMLTLWRDEAIYEPLRKPPRRLKPTPNLPRDETSSKILERSRRTRRHRSRGRVREQEVTFHPFLKPMETRINTCTAPSNATERSPARVRMEA